MAAFTRTALEYSKTHYRMPCRSYASHQFPEHSFLH